MKTTMEKYPYSLRGQKSRSIMPLVLHTWVNCIDIEMYYQYKVYKMYC